MLLIAVAILGWLVALVVTALYVRHQCPIEAPTRAVLLNSAGLPESVRTLRGAPPKEYARPHGRSPATIYHRIATAAVYQATEPRQPQ